MSTHRNHFGGWDEMEAQESNLIWCASLGTPLAGKQRLSHNTVTEKCQLGGRRRKVGEKSFWWFVFRVCLEYALLLVRQSLAGGPNADLIQVLSCLLEGFSIFPIVSFQLNDICWALFIYNLGFDLAPWDILWHSWLRYDRSSRRYLGGDCDTGHHLRHLRSVRIHFMCAIWLDN